MKLKSSKLTLIKLNHKTVVKGDTSEVIEVSVTDNGILPSLKWVRIPEIKPPGAKSTTAIDKEKILSLKIWERMRPIAGSVMIWNNKAYINVFLS